MKCKIALSLILCASFGFAQSYQAKIENTQKDGFYKIQITPEVLSAATDNLDFLRIQDKNKNEIPYVVYSDTNRNPAHFEKLEIGSKVAIKDSISSFVINNYAFKDNGELVLLITNSKINKYYNLSGSNDQKEWFGLVANQLLSNLNNESGTVVEKTISFPLNNYKFLKLDFIDKKSLPINLVSVGYFKGEKAQLENVILKDFKYQILQNKKEKKTIINFKSNNFQKVSGISFQIATKLYSRNAILFVNRTERLKKQTKNFRQDISNFVLKSNSSNSLFFDGIFEKDFTIEIENNDNQPLTFSKIEVLQKPLYIISDLKANEKYEVIIDSTLSKPQYDLEGFVMDFKKDYLKASISNLKKVTVTQKNASEKPFWQSKAFMWVCILFAIAIIGYFAIGLLKDMKKD
jgi:hypothetical protein